jgi:hypothetical protein
VKNVDSGYRLLWLRKDDGLYDAFYRNVIFDPFDRGFDNDGFFDDGVGFEESFAVRAEPVDHLGLYCVVVDDGGGSLYLYDLMAIISLDRPYDFVVCGDVS